MKTIQNAFLFIAFIAFAGMMNAQNSWSTSGNNPNSNCFIGTTTPVPLVMKTNGIERLKVAENGKLYIADLASTTTTALVVLPDGSLAKAVDPGTGGVDCNLLLWDGNGNAASPDCFIGTTNFMPFCMYANGRERMRITPEGNVVVHGNGAKAPFQVFDHMGITFNREDQSLTDVQRSIGFNLYRDGGNEYHFQTGTAAKIEFVSGTGLLHLGVTQQQSANSVATFMPGIQLNQYGKAGIGARPGTNDALVIGGSTLIQQAGNGSNSVQIGHNGTDAFIEVAGANNARLKINHQSAKMVEVGGDALFTQSVGIGTTNFQDNGTGKTYRLNVDGRIRATEIKVYSGWADHVFEPGYKLMPLREVDAYIQSNGHLPGLPSAAEVEANGVELGETQALLLEKIEELTLHLIRLEKENEVLKAEVGLMK